MLDPFVEAFEECLQDAVNYSKNLVLSLRRGFLPGFHNGFMVALSGGPDSTAALRAMWELSKKLDFRLGACHINYRLRGQESGEDEDFCRTMCDSLGIALDVRRAEDTSRRSEEHLRQLRYHFLYDAATRQNANYIVVAHTLDDQVETMLFRMFRGTSPAGLSGMMPARTIGDDRMVLRPMLYLTREQCNKYLDNIKLQPRQDSTNVQVDYSRNYLRNRIVPLIEERFPGFQQRMEQLRRIIVSENGHLADEAMDIFVTLQEASEETDRWELEILRDEPLAIQRRVLVLGLLDREVEPTYDRVETLMEMLNEAAAPSALSLNSQWDVRITADELLWEDRTRSSETAPDDFEIRLSVPGLNLVPQVNSAIHVKEWNGGTGDEIEFPPADAPEALVDLTAVRQPLVARRRSPGDVIQPFGMSKAIKLKRYLQTHKPQHVSDLERRHIVVIADQDEVIWIPGVGLSNKVKVSQTPTHRLSWVNLGNDDVNLC